MSRLHRHIAGVLLALLAFGITHASMADDGKRMSPTPALPKYQQECGACHTAYPPGMLPAVSWQHVMGSLPRHFGTDASLDAPTTRELSTWLAAKAGTTKRVSEAPPEDRITRSAWFIRKHDEISAATWKLPAVKSAANCAACHIKADQGNFNEHDVRIPR